MAPPEAPTLSAFPGAQGPEAGGAPPMAKMGAVPKLIFQAEMLLDTIARAVPAAAADVDKAKQIVRGILTKAIPGGAAGTPPPQGGPMGPPPPMGGMGGPVR